MQPNTATPPPLPPPPQRRSILEIMLDPRSIQWLLACGGLLLVAGVVIWLASLRFFEDPHVVAGCLGVGTLAMLAAGWWVIRKTQFQLAGKAVTLLACLVMPLNLWFYHAQGIMTLEGHLWMAAVVCCALYAASALVLRDSLLVYVLMAGVAGTGLLMLADLHKFAEIASPALMLVVMGLIGIHVERAFAESDSPFSRKRFGMAFFISGHVLLAGALLLLMGAQVTGWVIRPAFWGFNILPPAITTEPALKLLAIGLVLAGTYAYVYSDLVVRKVGFYVYPAAFTLLWAELLGLQMIDSRYRPEIILAAVSLTALALNLLRSTLKAAPPMTRALAPLAMLLSMMPVAYGVLLHFCATHESFNAIWPFTQSLGYVGAMLTTVIACRVGAFLYRKTDAALSGTYFFLTGAATLVGAAGLLAILGIRQWPWQAPVLMLIPIAYLIASRLYRDQVQRNSLLVVAQAATIALLVSVLASAAHIAPRVFEPVEGQKINLLLACFFAEAAIFYALLTAIRKSAVYIFFAAAMAGGAVWQVLSFYHMPTEAYMLTFAGLGLLLLIGSRFISREVSVVGATTSAGNALMTLSFLSSSLMVLSRLAGDRPLLSNAGLLGTMMLLMLAAAFVVGTSPWRRAYIVMAIVDGALACLLLGALADLSGWQKAEIFFVLSGIVLLVFGHVGWFREQNRPNDMVNFNLTMGALLAGVPILIAAVVHRFTAQISMPDELALLTISALMLISGLMLQLRATTIVGGGLLMLHLTMLLAFAGWKAQLALGVYLAMGGGVIFLLGLALAIYREQLVALPQRIQQRQGVFRVLAWR